MVWSAKGTNALPLVILHVFFRQRVLVALQRAQAICILRHAIIVNASSSRLVFFHVSHPFFFLICFMKLVGGFYNMICSFALL